MAKVYRFWLRGISLVVKAGPHQLEDIAHLYFGVPLTRLRSLLEEVNQQKEVPDHQRSSKSRAGD